MSRLIAALSLMALMSRAACGCESHGQSGPYPLHAKPPGG